MLNLFAQLRKADEAQRLVWGVIAAEQPDKSGEIMDYATAKPQFQKWSDGIAAATGGASLGNVRLMHGKDPIGKVVELLFDDLEKTISVCVKVIDDRCWKFVQEGVVSGFSIGGGYLKKWVDAADKALKRYTPVLSEVSLVDNPCLPAATFSMIKADGVSAEVEIKADGALSKLVDDAFDAAVGELEALLKSDPPKPYGDVAYADEADGKYPIDTVAHIRAAWNYINMGKNAAKLGDKAGAVKDKIVAAWKDKIDPSGPPSMAKMALLIGEPKSLPLALDLCKVIREVALEKGFYNVAAVARALANWGDIVSETIWEEAYEDDTASKLPQSSVDIMNAMRAHLIENINEETQEFFTDAERNGGDAIALIASIANDDVLNLGKADKIVALAKALKDIYDAEMIAVPLEKRGAQISKANMKHVQAAHDHMTAMGAKCKDENVEKRAPAPAEIMEAENGRLRKAVTGASSMIRTLQSQIEAQNARFEEQDAKFKEQGAQLAKLLAQPAPTTVVVSAFDKGDEMGDPAARKRPLAKDASDGVGVPIVFSTDPRERMAQAIKVLAAAGHAPGG